MSKMDWITLNMSKVVWVAASDSDTRVITASYSQPFATSSVHSNLVQHPSLKPSSDLPHLQGMPCLAPPVDPLSLFQCCVLHMWATVTDWDTSTTQYYLLSSFNMSPDVYSNIWTIHQAPTLQRMLNRLITSMFKLKWILTFAQVQYWTLEYLGLHNVLLVRSVPGLFRINFTASRVNWKLNQEANRTNQLMRLSSQLAKVYLQFNVTTFGRDASSLSAGE